MDDPSHSGVDAGVSPVKKNKKGKFVCSRQKETIINVYKSILLQQPKIKYMDLVLSVCKTTGIGRNTKLHTLESTNQSLMDENKRLEQEIETHIEDIGYAEIQLKEMKKKNESLKSEVVDTVAENDCLKRKITTLAEESKKMITLQEIDKLLETKLAKFENRIVKSLLTNSIDDNSGIIKEVKLNVTEKHDAVLPSSVIPSSLEVILPSMVASMVHSSSPISSLPAKSAQSVYDEFADLQIKQCTEWWCPVHSNFEVLVKKVKPTSYEDQNIIRRAKSRFTYWSKGDTARCCTLDRKRQTTPKTYVLPSFWPTVMPSDMDKLSNSLSKLNF